MTRALLLTLLLSALCGCNPGPSQAPPAKTKAEPPGRSLFVANCSTCHQQDGRGVLGQYPALGGSEWLTGEPDASIAIVLKGLEGEITVNGETFNSQMPTLDLLSDGEVAEILTYVRSSWGNSASAVSQQQVAAVRARLKDRNRPWNGEAELREFLGAKAPKVG